MTLLAPDRLWFLLPVVLFAIAYGFVQRRRRTVRHPDVGLVAAVAPKRAGWRRHLTAGALLLTAVALVGGLARPVGSEERSREDAVIMLAVDISGSMSATDVPPSRLEVAVAVAKDFVDSAPAGYRIGLVTFDVAGHTLAPPTTDCATVLDALDGLEPVEGTAAGEGLFTAIDVIEATTDGGPVVARDQPYSAVVLLADGASTVGRSLDTAAASAAERGVPVFTIAYGTDDGVAEINGKMVAVPADPEALAAVAEATGGVDYTAASGSQLAGVYDQIGARIATVTEPVELTVLFAAIAALTLAVALGTSVLWAPRLV